MRRPSPEERFWANVDKKGDAECWEWQRARDKNGYGRFYWKGKNQRAHRTSYELMNGPIPVGIMICHKCDNPPCVNPYHLFPGTNSDNVHDALSKGRHYTPLPGFGEDNPQTNLTSVQVREIKRMLAARVKTRDIAEQFSIAQSTIRSIRRGVRWGHITLENSTDGTR